MNIIEIDINKNLTTTYFNPSPHRFSPEETPVSERRIPLTYTCENCRREITFKTSDFEKHISLDNTNLTASDNKDFMDYMKSKNMDNLFFLDFYCPKCNQATKFLFKGEPSGYWGEFFFQIEKILVKKNN